MSVKDEKPTPHHNYHPIKILGIILVWTISLYIALVIIKNYDADLPSESTEFSRPHLIKNENICKSPECITLAHQLHNWQDISVDPCQDFYQAACGKYNEQNTVKGTRLSKTNQVINNLVEERLEKNQLSTSKSEQTMKAYYQKCKEFLKSDKRAAKIERYKEIFQTIKKVGPWPMLNRNWNESEFDLNDMMSNMASFGKTNFGLFAIQPTEDFTIEVSQSAVFQQIGELSKTYSENDTSTFVKDLLRINNITFDEELIETTEKEVEELLKAINAELIANQGPLSEKTIGFTELQRRVPSVKFEQIIKNLMHPDKKEQTWTKIAGKITANENEFLFKNAQNFENVMRNTPKQTLANTFIHFFIMSELQKIKREEINNCAGMTTSTFPLAALRIIVRNHFDKENIEIASKMVEDIRQSFIEMIQESTWLDKKTKQNAIRKAEKMRKMVGYPKELEVPGALDSFFETFVFPSNDSFHKLINIVEKFKIEQAINFVASSLQLQSNKDYFEANALYAPWRNLLTLNIPIINDPFFDSTYPDYAKIASIGAILGHEIGHGFDPNGRKFDENGKKRNWWTPEDSSEYDRRAQCLIDQYNNYDDPDFGKNLNGSTTIKEIASDTIGINTAWRTYKKLNLVNEPKIIGFEDYDTDKLFFRLAALNWCKPRSTYPLSQQLTLVHPTSSFRVNGIFSNTKSFAEAYNCPVGSPMNPVKKCELF